MSASDLFVVSDGAPRELAIYGRMDGSIRTLSRELKSLPIARHSYHGSLQVMRMAALSLLEDVESLLRIQKNGGVVDAELPEVGEDVGRYVQLQPGDVVDKIGATTAVHHKDGTSEYVLPPDATPKRPPKPRQKPKLAVQEDPQATVRSRIIRYLTDHGQQPMSKVLAELRHQGVTITSHDCSQQLYLMTTRAGLLIKNGDGDVATWRVK